MKSLATRQKVRLLTAFASLNNGHNFDLRTCYAGVKSSSKPIFVPAKPLRLQSAA
jgi:hypothetical protein